MDMQEINAKDETNSKNGLLGEYLKEKRTEKNYSLEKFSQKTKISINILKSIENNDYDHLPSAAYIKGFVQSYIKVLGLSHEEAINKMEYTYLNILGKPFPALNHTKLMNTSSVNRGSDSVTDPSEVIERNDSIIENTKTMIPIIIFAGVILVFVGGYKFLSSVIEGEVGNKKVKNLGPKIESSSALVNPKVKTEEAPKSTESITNTASTTSSATQATKTDTPAATVIKTEEQPKELPPQEIQRNFPHIDFKKIRSKLFTVNTSAPENDDTTLLPAEIKEKMNPDLQNILIVAVTGNTWMSFKIDEKPIENVIINKGKNLFIQGSEVRMFLGNINVTKIFYNNYLIDAPTKTGVKSLIFPEERNSNFVLPLFPKAKDDILYTSEDYIKRMKLEEEELGKKTNQ